MGLDHADGVEGAQVVDADVAVAVACGQVATVRWDLDAAGAHFHLVLSRVDRGLTQLLHYKAWELGYQFFLLENRIAKNQNWVLDYFHVNIM